MVKRKSGFIAFVTMFLLVVFALMGIAYWYSSRMNTDMVYMESQRIKARNYAQAGIECVKINICKSYESGHNTDMNLKSNKPKGYEKEFDQGGYRILSVEPFVSHSGKKCRNVPHVVKGRQIGVFDVWEVVSEGYCTNSKVAVQLKTTIRAYKSNIVY